MRTEGGNYAAYGQKLKIDRGNLAFNGPVDNPRLDIEATRPGLDIRVGVAVTGTAVEPARAAVLRARTVGGRQALVARARPRQRRASGAPTPPCCSAPRSRCCRAKAKARPTSSPARSDWTNCRCARATARSSETIVSLGKQLSQRWYVGYERSLNATTGNWQLIYRIAQRFTLRAQAGGDNALDLIWTWRWQ